jgi:hypothetical protein
MQERWCRRGKRVAVELTGVPHPEIHPDGKDLPPEQDDSHKYSLEQSGKTRKGDHDGDHHKDKDAGPDRTLPISCQFFADFRIYAVTKLARTITITKS